jgi:hypothetical protein
MYKYILVFLVLLAVFILSAKEVIEMPLISKAPVIDGIVTDGEWSGAVGWDEFYQTSPGDNTVPSERTEVFLAYDKENIYCLAKCYFVDINRLRDNHCSRD